MGCKELSCLIQHIGLQYSNVTYKQLWCYETPEGKTIFAQPQIRIRSNNGDALAAAAIAGLGITAGPAFILGRHIKENRLVALLNGYQRPATGIHAVYPPGRLIPKRIQVFSDFLASRFGDQPYWDEGLPV
jgi:DNA-binding transcriptional LysR family regulator